EAAAFQRVDGVQQAGVGTAGETVDRDVLASHRHRVGDDRVGKTDQRPCSHRLGGHVLAPGMAEHAARPALAAALVLAWRRSHADAAEDELGAGTQQALEPGGRQEIAVAVAEDRGDVLPFIPGSFGWFPAADPQRPYDADRHSQQWLRLV